LQQKYVCFPSPPFSSSASFPAEPWCVGSCNEFDTPPKKVSIKGEWERGPEHGRRRHTVYKNDLGEYVWRLIIYNNNNVCLPRPSWKSTIWLIIYNNNNVCLPRPLWSSTISLIMYNNNNLCLPRPPWSSTIYACPPMHQPPFPFSFILIFYLTFFPPFTFENVCLPRPCMSPLCHSPWYNAESRQR
jgi:hypothetical protein